MLDPFAILQGRRDEIMVTELGDMYFSVNALDRFNAVEGGIFITMRVPCAIVSLVEPLGLFDFFDVLRIAKLVDAGDAAGDIDGSGTTTQ